MTSSHRTNSYDLLVDSVGSFMQYWGFKNIHGQVWTSLFLAEKPLNASALVRQLDVSKALISLALKELLQCKVIIELEKTEPSTRHYTINYNVAEVIASVLLSRERVMIQTIIDRAEELSNSPQLIMEHHLSTERVQLLKEMSVLAQAILDQLINMESPNCDKAFQLLSRGLI